jgi:hypothetical protein
MTVRWKLGQVGPPLLPVMPYTTLASIRTRPSPPPFSLLPPHASRPAPPATSRALPDAKLTTLAASQTAPPLPRPARGVDAVGRT